MEGEAASPIIRDGRKKIAVYIFYLLKKVSHPMGGEGRNDLLKHSTPATLRGLKHDASTSVETGQSET